MNRDPMNRKSALSTVFVLIVATLAPRWQADSKPFSSFEQAQLKEVVLENGGAREVKRVFTLPVQSEEPTLVVYVPATREAKGCVGALIQPIIDAGDTIEPVKVVTILDLSETNAVLAWVDETGLAHEWWDIDEAICAYTLFHPASTELTGSGLPTQAFLTQLLQTLADD